MVSVCSGAVRSYACRNEGDRFRPVAALDGSMGAPPPASRFSRAALRA